MKKQHSITLSLGFLVLLVSSSMTAIQYYDPTYADKMQNLTKDKVQFYACGKYHSHILHCDPSVNKRESYHLKANGTIPIYEVTDDAPQFVDGIRGKALQMHAYYKDAVRFANAENISSKQFSVSFWVKTSAGDDFSYGRIISHADTIGKSGWFLDVKNSPENSTQHVSFNIYNSTGALFTVGYAPIQPGRFVNIVITFDGSTLKMYKDGVLDGETQFNGDYVANPIVPLTLGMGSDCSCATWSGLIDELLLYNTVLTEHDVNQIVKNNLTNVVSKALVGYWPLDGNLNDLLGNNYNGTEHTLLASMVFTPDGRLFFDEIDTGKIRIMKDDKVLAKPFVTISDTYVNWEQGLLGLAIDPEFRKNHFVYLYYTTLDNDTGQPFNRVVRFTDQNNIGTNMVIILDKIPATKLGFHAGGALAFGPDDKLYITVGDAYNDVSAQDSSALTGKVLRINRDGSIPQDNPYRIPIPSLIPFHGLIPFFDSLSCYLLSCRTPVYNLGHRNIYGIAFDYNNNGFGIVTEAANTTYDKISDVRQGGNYGWPNLQPINFPPELTNNSSIKPLRSYWEDITPTQAIYYDGDKIPQLNGKFLFGTYTGDIYAVKIDKFTGQVTEEERIDLPHYPEDRVASPVIGIAQSPDGSIYYGGYNIYKLESVDFSSKEQFIFPLEIETTASEIKHLQLEPLENRIGIDIQSYDDSKKNLSPSLVIIIPKKILDGIFNVASNNVEQAKGVTQPQQASGVHFTIDNSTSSDYTTVNIRLNAGINSKLWIIGKTVIY
jgi:glucose/arabinose dehydrogenase